MDLLNFNKNDIFYYLITGTILFYISYISDISVKYVIPLIIFLLIIYFRQTIKLDKEKFIDNILIDIKNKILKNDYKYLNDDNDILYFLNDIIIYNKYSPIVFKDLLEVLNKYYEKKDVYNLLLVLNIFDRFIYALPIELSKDFYLNINKLKSILYINLDNQQYKRVEMQSYIPYNIYNYDNLRY